MIESFEIAKQFIDIILHYKDVKPKQAHTKHILQNSYKVMAKLLASNLRKDNM